MVLSFTACFSLPPFLCLPLELHRDIIDRLPILDRESLRSTNHYFRSIVKSPTIAELLAAEAIDNEHFSCSDCLRLLPLKKFSNDMRKGRKGRRGSEAHTRFCVKCGVDRRRYKPGTELMIMEKRYVICKVCYRHTHLVGSNGACSSCLPLSSSTRGTGDADAYSDHARYELEENFINSTWRYTGRGRAEELQEFYNGV
jgi:hypothetical protein